MNTISQSSEPTELPLWLDTVAETLCTLKLGLIAIGTMTRASAREVA